MVFDEERHVTVAAVRLFVRFKDIHSFHIYIYIRSIYIYIRSIHALVRSRLKPKRLKRNFSDRRAYRTHYL